MCHNPQQVFTWNPHFWMDHTSSLLAYLLQKLNIHAGESFLKKKIGVSHQICSNFLVRQISESDWLPQWREKLKHVGLLWAHMLQKWMFCCAITFLWWHREREMVWMLCHILKASNIMSPSMACITKKECGIFFMLQDLLTVNSQDVLLGESSVYILSPWTIKVHQFSGWCESTSSHCGRNGTDWNRIWRGRHIVQIQQLNEKGGNNQRFATNKLLPHTEIAYYIPLQFHGS